MSLFARSTDVIVTGALKKITFNHGARAENEPVLHVEGAKIGFIAWLLNAVGFADSSFSFSVDSAFITIVEGNKTFQFFPANEGHSANVGYTTKKWYLVSAVMSALGAVLVLLAGVAMEDVRLTPVLSALAFAALFVWLYTKSARLEFTLRNIGPDRATRVIGVRLKSGLDGPNVTPQDLQQIAAGLRSMTRHQSRHYMRSQFSVDVGAAASADIANRTPLESAAASPAASAPPIATEPPAPAAPAQAPAAGSSRATMLGGVGVALVGGALALNASLNASPPQASSPAKPDVSDQTAAYTALAEQVRQAEIAYDSNYDGFVEVGKGEWDIRGGSLGIPQTKERDNCSVRASVDDFTVVCTVRLEAESCAFAVEATRERAAAVTTNSCG